MLQRAIDDALKEKPKLQKKYGQPDPSSDRLYKSDITHPENNPNHCAAICGDDPPKLILRRTRADYDDNPKVHHGLLASGNQLMMDASIRDLLPAEKNVLCFEMEAAGLMNRFPCLIIRGICDYSGTHKNKVWQGYAAVAAAAYARHLLLEIPPSQVENERRLGELLSGAHDTLTIIEARVDTLKSRSDYKADLEILNWLSTFDYAVVQQLLAAGGDVNCTGLYRVTPLWWAVDNAHEAVAKLLLEQADIDPDYISSEPFFPSEVHKFYPFAGWIRYSTREYGNASIGEDSYQRTPLPSAAGEGLEEVVKLLLTTPRVNVNSKTPGPLEHSGLTPLSYAAKNGHVAVVRRLLKAKGIDCNSKDPRGLTALSLAAENGHENVIPYGNSGKDLIPAMPRVIRIKPWLIELSRNAHPPSQNRPRLDATTRGSEASAQPTDTWGFEQKVINLGHSFFHPEKGADRSRYSSHGFTWLSPNPQPSRAAKDLAQLM
ncbi:hypothetical protein CEP52_015232 [Fusarium oligoseptatum]|uniref:Uncharacterized protein n=1 Tax=Fusarium oligoseptatum TaxID=2604345 RepID=A0A428SF28_9HYPO|nr:hypothetical protein CEP52_015232 [Fusarium oligoseptatum]